jgi:hypothetical protein
LLVKTQSPNTFNTAIWYQHWWIEIMRSTLEMSGIWNAMNTNILGQGSALNKQLSIAHANLFWSPVAFIDLASNMPGDIA